MVVTKGNIGRMGGKKPVKKKSTSTNPTTNPVTKPTSAIRASYKKGPRAPKPQDLAAGEYPGALAVLRARQAKMKKPKTLLQQWQGMKISKGINFTMPGTLGLGAKAGFQGKLTKGKGSPEKGDIWAQIKKNPNFLENASDATLRKYDASTGYLRKKNTKPKGF
jgi:hypothetical protein